MEMLLTSTGVPGTKLWRAVFSKDFSSVEVLDSVSEQFGDGVTHLEASGVSCL
jgi:hypothetical protein